jgi:hypothetical protein
LSTDAPVTWGCPLGKAPGGERHVSERIQKALAPDERGMICLSLRGTRPSLGPEARARKSALNLLGDTPRGCRVRNSIAVGQTRESGRNRHRGWSESDECTARHSTPLPQGRGRVEKEKEDGRGHRPCEETRVAGSVARMSEMQLQKSVGVFWSQIRSANASSKRTVRVE